MRVICTACCLNGGVFDCGGRFLTLGLLWIGMDCGRMMSSARIVSPARGTLKACFSLRYAVIRSTYGLWELGLFPPEPSLR